MFDPSFLTAQPSTSSHEPVPEPEASSSTAPVEHGQTHPPYTQPADESLADLAHDPFAAYFAGAADPGVPPKVLVTTSPRPTRASYDFCDELVNVLPGAEFVRRKKGKGFEMGRIAGWAAGRGYSHMVVVNEDTKKPSEWVSCGWSMGGVFMETQTLLLLFTFLKDRQLTSSCPRSNYRRKSM